MDVNRLITAAAFATCLSAGAANATVIFIDKNAPQQPGEENILFGSSQTSTTINGSTNQSNTPVQFTSTQGLETVGIGQAFLQVSGDTNQNPIPITNFTFTVRGHTFGDFIFKRNNGTGTETVSVITNDGTFTHDLALGNGENFLTITTACSRQTASTSCSSRVSRRSRACPCPRQSLRA